MDSPQKKQNKESFVVHLDSSRVLWMIAMSLFLISFFFLFGYWVGTDTDSLTASHIEYSNKESKIGDGFSHLDTSLDVSSSNSSGLKEGLTENSGSNKQITGNLDNLEIEEGNNGKTRPIELNIEAVNIESQKGNRIQKIGRVSKDKKAGKKIIERKVQKRVLKKIVKVPSAKIQNLSSFKFREQNLQGSSKGNSNRTVLREELPVKNPNNQLTTAKVRENKRPNNKENKGKENFVQLKENTIYNIQVSANRVSKNAEKMKSILLEKGYPAYIQTKQTSPGNNIHIVRVGPFYSPKDLKESYNALKNLSFAKDSIVVQR